MPSQFRGRSAGGGGAPPGRAGFLFRRDTPPPGGELHILGEHAFPLGGGLLPAYWLAWLATVTFFGGFYALLVPLPRYLADIGLPDWQIGLVLGAFGIASLIGRPVAGIATDRAGARPIMLVSAASLALGAAATPQTTNLALLMALRLLQAAGYVGFTTAGTALVVSLVPPEARARRLAVFGAAANVAISLTPAATTALLAFAPPSAGLLSAAALACAGGALASALPSIRPGAAGTGKTPWALPRRVWLPMLATGLLGAGFAAFFQFAPILAERRGISSGVLYAIYGAAIIATRVFGNRILDQLSVARIVALSAVLMALGHIIVVVSRGQGLLVLAPALVAVSGGLFHPTLIAHHAALLPDTPGRASAAFYVAFDLGIGLGSWLFGIMLQLAGLPGLYATAAVLALSVLPLSLALRQPHS
jgi:predicted MFS family arabinose efflux permease